MDHLEHFSYVEKSPKFDKLHALRTADLTYQIAVTSKVSQQTADKYKDAAFWHDCGKLFLPLELLIKPGPLDDDEFELIRTHTSLGFDYIEGSKMPNGKMRADVALYHHERMNGSGYIGLRSKMICKVARIVAVADAFDAMTHDRPYHKAVSEQEAIKELVRNSGLLFDDRYVHALIEVLSDRH